MNICVLVLIVNKIARLVLIWSFRIEILYFEQQWSERDSGYRFVVKNVHRDAEGLRNSD